MSHFLEGAALALVVAAWAPGQQQSLCGWGWHTFDTASDATTPVAIAAGRGLLVTLGADGRAYCRGVNLGMAPEPPTGLQYVQVAVGGVPLGILSDGSMVQWLPACPPWFAYYSLFYPPPSLPPGVTAVQVASGGDCNVMLRSDGVVVVWGVCGWGQSPVPAFPPGVACTQITAGPTVVMALLSNGDIAAWGSANHGQTTVPALGPGQTYAKVGCGYQHAVALRSDGSLVAWGDNSWGACNVPALPAGVTYTAGLYVGPAHNVARRSDGTWVAWGRNIAGQCNIPQPPSGMTYVDAALDLDLTVLLRSDGQLLFTGVDGHLAPGPAVPSGERFLSFTMGDYMAIGVLSTGTLLAWGGVNPSLVPPAPPTGVSYTQVTYGSSHDFALALRSDGQIDGWGLNWGSPDVRVGA